MYACVQLLHHFSSHTFRDFGFPLRANYEEILVVKGKIRIQSSKLIVGDDLIILKAATGSIVWRSLYSHFLRGHTNLFVGKSVSSWMDMGEVYHFFPWQLTRDKK